jgi:aminoglycoside phosphotransferase (APT) family kinase protein
MMRTTIGDKLGGWTIVRELSPGRSWQGRESGRDVVLKVLEDDCLLEGKLHPSIRQRLERVRELPARLVANLHGVERDGDLTYLVWDYVEGKTVRELEHEDRGDDAEVVDWRRVARELVLAVRGLHARGIVHGAIHGGNVVIDPRGRVWLIDVSPLLWGEEQEDARGIVDLLRGVSERHHDGEILRLLQGIELEEVTMGELERRLFGREDQEQELILERESERWRSMIWAGIALAVGIGVALGVYALQ